MSPVHPVRLRLALTPPQAVTHTSALVWDANGGDPSAPGLVLAPSAGGDLTSAVLHAVGSELSKRGHPVLVFNFGYREAGRRMPDPPARLQQAFRDAIAVARARFGEGRPLLLGGRSMGGRVASQLAASNGDCAGLVLLGYPLHPANCPQRLRTEHWPSIVVPSLFVQGDCDELCDLALLERERSAHLDGRSAVHVVAGANHSFGVRKRDGHTRTQVLDEVVETVASWVDAR